MSSKRMIDIAESLKNYRVKLEKLDRKHGAPKNLHVAALIKGKQVVSVGCNHCAFERPCSVLQFKGS